MSNARDFNVAKMLLARNNRHKKIRLPEVKDQPKGLSMAMHHWTLFKKLNACRDFTAPELQQHFHHVFDAISLVEPLKDNFPKAKEIFERSESMIRYFATAKRDEYLLLLAKYQLTEQARIQQAGAPIRLQLSSLKNAYKCIEGCRLSDKQRIPIREQIVEANDHLADIFYQNNHKRYAMHYGEGSLLKAKAVINGALKGYAEQFVPTARVYEHQATLLELKAEVKAEMLESVASLTI